METKTATEVRREEWLAIGLIVLAGLLVYANSFSGPFVFDDIGSITGNKTLRHLWPLVGSGSPLAPPLGDWLTVTGRPVLNLSLAVNWALGGDAVGGYHAVNVAIHLLAGLTLFGLLRRTFSRPPLRERIGDAALWLAGATALLWTIHPLQTEAVSYVVQRAEALMGLFYLLTLYGFIRGAEAERGKWMRRRWFGLSIAACLLGMGTKEVMVSAPLTVLLYDRTFVAGTVREAWRRRWGFYLGLAAPWIVLAALMIGSGSRGGTVGFEVGGGPADYALSQVQVIPHYLRLTLWPHPLTFDYGKVLDFNPWLTVWGGFLLVTLLIGTAIAGWQGTPLGFAGAAFFLILAPTSSFIPSGDPIWEHRFYLPLAPVLAIGVVGLHRGLGRKSFFLFLALALVWGGLTWLRNADYQSRIALWSDTVAQRPENPKALQNLGDALFDAGRIAEALDRLRKAERLDPGNSLIENSLGAALERAHDFTGAISCFQLALRADPNDPKTLYNFGNALLHLGKFPEAAARFADSLRLDPDNARAENSLGVALIEMKRLPEARLHFEAALRIDPGDPGALQNLARLRRTPPAEPDSKAQLAK